MPDLLKLIPRTKHRMFNTYSSSFYGRGYKVKKALKFTVTSVSALKALCPTKNRARIFHAFKKIKASKQEKKKEKKRPNSEPAH